MEAPDLPELPLPALVLRHAASHGADIALRQKRGGKWNDITWSEYADRVRACGAGMRELGFDDILHAGVFADNCIEWVIAQMATGLLGGCTLGCYPTSSREDVEYALGQADAQIVFCGNASYVETVLSVRQNLPKLRWIVVFEDTDLADAGDGVLRFARLEELGRQKLQHEPGLLDGLAEGLSLDQPGLIVFTSGSTGPPKAAMLTFRNMRSTATGFAPMLGFGPEAVILSYLPLCHIAEQAMTCIAAVNFRSTVAFGGGLPGLIEDLRDVRPTYLSGVPRVWLRLQSHVREYFETSGRGAELDRAVEAGMAVAFRPEEDWTQAEREALARHEAPAAEARALVGLDRAAVSTSGAASLSAEVLGFFRALGFNLLELYGQTESCGVMTLQRPGRVVPGTVGEPIPTIDLKIAEDGEILVRGDAVFAGYYKNPQATEDALEGGWLHTGDVGRIENGQVRIVDRKKDIMITDGGKNISPAEIEARMRTSDLIQECILVADGRKYPAALIQIDPSGFPEDLADAPYAQVVANARTEALVRSEIHRLNAALPNVAQIKRAYILSQPLSAAEGELTPTLKLRRFIVHQNNSDEIEALYAGTAGFDVETGRGPQH